MKRGRYYLGRVIKIGDLNQKQLIDAIRFPKIVAVGKFQWTFTDTVDQTDSDQQFIFSKLSKYSREGHVKIIDEETNSQKDELVPDLLVESSPFVYLPEYSGIAYLRVWDHISEPTFRSRFKYLVEEAYERFFVN